MLLVLEFIICATNIIVQTKVTEKAQTINFKKYSKGLIQDSKSSIVGSSKQNKHPFEQYEHPRADDSDDDDDDASDEEENRCLPGKAIAGL